MKMNLYKVIGRGAALVSACVAVSGMLAACTSSDGKKVAGGSSEDAGITAVKDWEVAGVSQKGPFVTGSAVTVQELDGITLKQTGKSFKGSIKSDKGDFAIKDINLQSQYAILEASGYYRDEITGKKSTGTVTLRALTDLTDRKTVNINLLTHLEYERVMYLVTEKKKPIAAAKAQADEEILAAFGIEGDFGKSEDLNIFESGDGNAALLAISVLMHADADVAGLTERMGEFSIAMAEGGDWEDADTKAVIADWACDADLKGTLATVRKNVEDWKYSDSVPAFEKYVTNFWWDNYGLGACTEKREGDIKRNVNKLSKMYNEYFVCESGRWHIPGEEPRSSSSVEPDPSGTSFGIMKDSRDGQEYKTIRIGNQVWMAENLKYAAAGSRCYGDDEKNCEKYGRLYNWDIALDTISEGCGVNFDKCTLKEDFYPRQGVCPDGWHLPDAGEWDDLLEYAGNNDGVDEAGFSLQSYYWDDDWEKQYGTDKFGFNAMPAGMFDGEEYVGLDSTAVFWTSRISNMSFIMGGSFSTLDYVMFEKKDTDITTYRGGNVEWALSVRCVKGTGNKRPESSSSVASSSSYKNPFAGPQAHDSIPFLPDEVAFLEDFFAQNEYKGYLTFENGKQEDWLVSKMMASNEGAQRESLLVAMGDSLNARGFEYEGLMLIDSALCLQAGDSSHAYVKKVENTTYRVYVTQTKKLSYSSITGIFIAGWGFDLKIVAHETGVEENPIIACSSLRFEEDFPEDIAFLNGYVTRKTKTFWSDDSLAISWSIRDWTDTVITSNDGSSSLWYQNYPDSVRFQKEKVDVATAEFEKVRQSLVGNGFTLIKEDTIESGTDNECSLDSLIRRYYYTRETATARYEVRVFSSIAKNYDFTGGGIYAIYDYYGVSIALDIYYKNKPE